MGGGKTLIFEIPTLEMVRGGYPLSFLDEFSQVACLGPNEFARIQVAITEAITNSVEHGNLGLKSEWKEQFDELGVDKFSIEKAARLKIPKFAQKKVKIVVEYSDKSLDISVEDEGDGFAPDGHLCSSGEESHGRGLFMIKAAMDSVEFAENGRVIRMKKQFK
jgi:anti-sigma regulatory factor (Ser/Thr protein kinase)